jgi:hypothetical protein
VELTIAEGLVLVLFVLLVVWALTPLRHWIRDSLERRSLRGRHGQVIEARFRDVPRPRDDDQN